MTNFDDIFEEGFDLSDEELEAPAFEVWRLIFDEEGNEHVDWAECLGSYETRAQAVAVVDEISSVSDLLSDAELSDVIDSVGYGGRIEVRVENSESILDDSNIEYWTTLYY